MATIRDARPGEAAGVARVHVETWRTAYRRLLPDDFLTALSVEHRERRWRETIAAAERGEGIVVVAEAAGEIVGIASGVPAAGRGRSGYDAELSTLYVLEAFQGRGLGRALLAAVAQRLADRGARSLLLWVLAEGPARGFYEALGGEEVGAQPITIGGTTLAEVAYGWRGAAFSALAGPSRPSLGPPDGGRDRPRIRGE